MANQNNPGVFLRNTDLTVEGDNYAAETSSVALTPSFTDVSWTGMADGAQEFASGAPTWTVDITAKYSDDPDSLFSYLWDGQGNYKTFTFAPKAGGRTWTVEVYIKPGSVGGAVNTWSEFTVSLPVKGQPVRGAAV